MNKSQKKNNHFYIKILVVFFIILMIFLIYIKIKNDNNKAVLVANKTDEIFNSIDKKSFVNVTKYIVYGTHFNIEGTVNIPKISGISIEKTDIIIKNSYGEETSITSNISYANNTLSFSTTDQINSGLNLEELSINNYYILLKVVFSNSDIKYYSLKNDTKYSDITYYSITKNETNNKINIKFDNYNDIPFIGIDVSSTEQLPDEVYDIVIDPGHGGSDIGSTSQKYKEADIVLDCAKILKEKLEASGLKVRLTRDGTEVSTINTSSNIYDSDGRVTIANESNAKVLISLHMHNNTTSSKKGGVKVYSPPKCDLNFAKLLANNIVSMAQTSYSSQKTYKQLDGVYVQNFNNLDILAFKSKAISGKYEPYKITTDTPYLYMIREIGGICTNAFVDGRNTAYSANKYFDSNVGIEGYVIELGSMNVKNDLKNITSNMDSYMQGICNSIKTFYNIN